MSYEHKAIAVGHYHVRCLDPEGNLKWEDEFDNLVVDEGLNYLLNIGLNGDSQLTTWYVGLLADAQTPLAAWGATEVGAADFVSYDEATLQTWTPNGASTAKSITNSSSTADFTINGGAGTVGGAFLISTNAKATPAGTLYSAGNFSASKSVNTGDTLQVTATFTQAAA
jgi:hypothetical protein